MAAVALVPTLVKQKEASARGSSRMVGLHGSMVHLGLVFFFGCFFFFGGGVGFCFLFFVLVVFLVKKHGLVFFGRHFFLASLVVFLLSKNRNVSRIRRTQRRLGNGANHS